MPSKKSFYGANISYKDVISVYYRTQGTFSCFVIQPMIADEDTSDGYTIALWAVDNRGAVMNGFEPISLPANKHSLPIKKRVQFANVYLTKEQLDKLYSDGTFNLGLNPIPYSANDKYVGFEIFNASEEQVTTLGTINPSPPATRS